MRTAEKNEARARLLAVARHVVHCLRGATNLTESELMVLGILVRAGRSPRVGRPETAPSVSVVSAVGHTLRVRLKIAGVGRRGRPRGTIGALVFRAIGQHPPASSDGWHLARSTSSTAVTIRFDSSLPPGMQVWVCARWVSPRLQPGPMSNPITTHLPGGNVGPQESLRKGA